ncbi:hypothetical protein JOC86_003865 [Bacillus pakistanensis]|uniref:Heparin-sulfate lyase N-terminal domain-containing protein n=1 Tax=Rossellomorea pakistanensis TaxID=992288 RepID=A0ABS2NHH1_9BACI|nr:alginate lyase family protein [Bacillus pakistanensis]MBM7587292.1 hypothetical protein [Bacillus pakistanensis]
MYVGVEETDFLKKMSWKLCGKETRELLFRAKEACQNRFVFTHPWDMERCEEPVSFSNKIDWTYRLNEDEEWTFMLNRHRFMAEIGQSYLLTGEEEFVHHWKRLFYDWVLANQDPTIHPLTYRKIDAGIRLVNWLKGHSYISSSANWSKEDDALFYKQLKEHGEYLSRLFTPFDFQSNWGFIETNGLLQSAFMMEKSMKNEWLNAAISRLEKMIELQIPDDGYQNEQSPMYHHEVLFCLIEITIVLQRNRISVPCFVNAAVDRMLTASFGFMKPNGHQPMLGDSDDTDVRGVLAIGAVLLKRSDLFDLSNHQIGLDFLWYFGEEGLKIYSSLTEELPQDCSVSFQQAGVTVMRNGWSHKDDYLLFDHGILGQVNKGHGHDDTLHLELMTDGREFLVDGGRYTYCETQEREYFKAANRHNTVTVDGLSPSIYKGTWEWEQCPRPIDSFVRFHERYDYSQSSHTGFWRLPSPVHVTRRVFYRKSLYWFVIDSFESNGTHNYEQHFHFPEHTQLEWNDRNELFTTYKEGTNIKILPLAFSKEDQLELKKGLISRHYNQLASAPHAMLQYKNRKQFAAPFIIVPSQAGEDVSLRVKSLPVSSIKERKEADSDVLAFHIQMGDVEDLIICSLTGSDSFIADQYQVCGEVILISNREDGSSIEVIR